jgi:hypothetical protein
MYLPTYCEHLTCGKVVGQAVRAPEVTTCTYTRKRGRP